MTPVVKICGLSTALTLDAALDAGADMVGFVFFPKSPRHIDWATAPALGRQARGRATIVALSVDADDDTLRAQKGARADDFAAAVTLLDAERFNEAAGAFDAIVRERLRSLD